MSDKELDRWGIAGAILAAMGGAITLFVNNKRGNNTPSTDKK